MKRILVVVVLLVTGVLAASLAAAAAELPAIPPLPDKFKDIQMVNPDPSVPPDVAAFWGEWEGVWGGAPPSSITSSGSLPKEVRRAKLIIYKVAGDKVKYLYGWGDSPYYTGAGGWRQGEAEVNAERGKKRFSLMTGSGSMGFYLEDGVLMGLMGGVSVEMKRVK